MSTHKWYGRREHVSPDNDEHAAMCLDKFGPYDTFKELRAGIVNYVVAEGLASTNAQVRGRSLDLVGQLVALEEPAISAKVEADQLRYSVWR